MDWNWFFSSVAQCGAALMGIIGAFVISKLLNENERYYNLKQTYRDLFFERRSLLNRICKCLFRWYNEQTIIESEEFWEDYNQEEHDDIQDLDKRADAYLWRVEGLFEHTSNIEFVKKLFRKNDNDLNEYYCIFGPSGNLDLFKKLIAEKEKIDSTLVACTDVIAKFKVLIKDVQTNLDSFKQLNVILITLMLGVFFIVCYPLSFLPIPKDSYPEISYTLINVWHHVWSFQGWILFLVLLFIESIFAVFIIHLRNLKIKYKVILKHITNKHINLWGYSDIFGMKENEQQPNS